MNESLKQLCISYFSGKADEADSARIIEFLHESPENVATFREWEKEWRQTEIPTVPQIRAYKKTKNRIGSRQAMRYAIVAASIAAAIALLAIFFPFWKGGEPAEPLILEPNIFSVETRHCEQTKVVLPDSTVVWLNAASRLSYSDDYMKGTRKVSLEGEGFFDVKSLPGHDFVVELGGNEITVHGTKFDACAYPGESAVEAALLEGSISFSNPTLHVEMQPGEILSYNPDKEKLLKYAGDVKSKTSWLGGTLVYSSTGLSDLLARISSLSGQKISYINHGKAERSITIILNIKESVPNILDAISSICPVSWKVSEGGGYVVETK
ncbi:MAG: FecR family protein [Bacteroidales bacterium]|nr:FecR family protein [Bacteroidales bacterium]